MRVVAAISVVAVVTLLAFLGFSGRFFHGEERPGLREDYFKKLQIEKLGKRITAPEFVLEDLSGKAIGLKELRGKVIFLNFWATWCIPCRQEMPAMEKLHREFSNRGLKVVAVNYRETKEEVRKFVDELGLTFTILLDKDGKVSEQYGVWALPISYFVNRQGEFVAKASGSRDWVSPEARAFFLALLVEKPQ